jgi:hypothetical protein
VTQKERNTVANLSMLLHVPFGIVAEGSTAAFIQQIRDIILGAMSHRQYDYGALAEFSKEYTGRQLFNAGWTFGVNFIADSLPLNYPNALFKERIDQHMIGVTPPKTLMMSARLSNSELRLSIECYRPTRNISAAKLQAIVTEIVQKILN